MKLGGNSGNATRKNFAGLRGELGEKLGVGGDNLVRRDVVTTTRHSAVRLAEVDTALDCFWLGHLELSSRLAEFAVKGAAFQEVIEFHFLQTAWGAEALLVTGGHVT